MWKITVLCTIIGFATADQIIYKDYKIFAINQSMSWEYQRILGTFATYINEPELQRELCMFTLLAENEFGLIIAPNNLDAFYKVITVMNESFRVVIGDVQEWLCKYKPNLHKQSYGSVPFDFTKYHNMDEIYANLDELAAKYPDKVQTVVGGKTLKGRDIKGVKVSFKANNPGIFIEGGIHGNDQMSPATVMYILHQLLTSNDIDVRELAERHDWYIFPLFNPDDYECMNILYQMWEKDILRSVDCFRDINNNWYPFPFFKDFPCMTVSGSFVKIKPITGYIDSIYDKFYAYISFRGDGQSLYSPYLTNTKNSVCYINSTKQYEKVHAIATKAVEALENRYGTKYEIKNVTDLATDTANYIFNHSDFRVSHIYQYYLRKRHLHRLIPRDQFIPIGEETLDSLVAMFKEIKAREYPKTLATIL